MQLKLISLNNIGRKKPNVPRAGVKRGGMRDSDYDDEDYPRYY